MRTAINGYGLALIRTQAHIGAYNYWSTNDLRADGTYISGGFCTAVRLVGARFARNYVCSEYTHLIH